MPAREASKKEVIRPYNSGGKSPSSEILCTDKSEGPRLKHAVIFTVKVDQHETVLTRPLRDKRISVEVDQVKPNFSGAITFRGSMDEGSLPPANGPLKVEKAPARV